MTTFNHTTLKNILISINNKTFTFKDLEKYHLHPKHQIILTTAFYHKNNYPLKAITKYLKDQKNIYAPDSNLIKVISYLEKQLKSSKFTIDLYLKASKINLNNEELVIRNITELISNKSYYKALKLCNETEYNNNQIIISLKVKILFILNHTKEALKICQNENHQNSSAIQVEYLKHLYYLKKYEDALNIIENPKFIHNPSIAWYHAKILKDLGCYLEAYNICNDKHFKENEKFIKLKLKLIPKIKTIYQKQVINLLKLRLASQESKSLIML